MQTDLNNIQFLFDKMEKNGFDITSELKWEFFFLNNNIEGLKKVYEELKDHNYKIEKLEEVDPGEWKLYVSKMEVLSADKLHRINIAFNELAEYCGVDLYDGWDVERV